MSQAVGVPAGGLAGRLIGGGNRGRTGHLMLVRAVLWLLQPRGPILRSHSIIGRSIDKIEFAGTHLRAEATT